MIDVTVSGLVKSFEIGSNILDGLSFQVEAGERVGILGPNGCGKTTLFRILTGALDYDEGQVSVAPGKRLGLISQLPVYPAGWTAEDVLQHAFRASMHIAGYSVQGKRNATQMCLDEIARMFGLKRIDISGYPYPASSQQNSNEPDWLAAVTDQLKAAPTAFEALRKAYPLRGV